MKVQQLNWLLANPVRHKNMLPVTAKMSYNVTDNGDGTYTLGEIYINGSILDENTVYTVTMFGDDSFIEDSIYCNCPMPETLKDKMNNTDTNVYTLFNTALEAGNQMEAPEAYVTIQKQEAF